MLHALKTHREYFLLAWAKIKPVEVRFNDRNFQPGDLMILREYDPKTGKYSGREIHGKIWHVYANSPGLLTKWVILFYDETARHEAPKISFEDEGK